MLKFTDQNERDTTIGMFRSRLEQLTDDALLLPEVKTADWERPALRDEIDRQIVLGVDLGLRSWEDMTRWIAMQLSYGGGLEHIPEIVDGLARPSQPLDGLRVLGLYRTLEPEFWARLPGRLRRLRRTL